MIIGLLGLANSGKGTASEFLQAKLGLTHVSFADSLKRAISEIFGWPFEMLQGKTKASREWREQVDPWWAERLNMPGLTPRWVLQYWGTEVGRQSFHPDIWVASLEKKLLDNSTNKVVDDCRFANEINAIRKAGGIIIQIQRDHPPVWLNCAIETIEYLDDNHDLSLAPKNKFMHDLYPKVHISEWGWAKEIPDYVILNDSSLEHLHQKLLTLWNDIS